MKLYGLSPQIPTACQWYRTIMPWRTANRMGLATPMLDHPEVKIPNEAERRAMAVLYADIIQHYHSYNPGFIAAAKQAEEFPAYWETEERWNFGPHFVFDTDDNLFAVEPLNPAFRALGWRVWVNGEWQVINKRGVVTINIPGKGDKILYQDGLGEFDVEANMQRLVTVRMNMKAAHLITCTTHRCAKYVVEETGNEKVHIFPNCIDFGDWPKIRLQDDDRVRILWQSSSCHFDDMWNIAQAMGEVQRQYPEVDYIIFGSPYEWLTNQLDPDRTEILPWVAYSEYMLRVNMLGADISLAPLHPSPFNDCRSAIRMYEAAACWKPMATLAEDTGPFHDEIIPGKTGLLFKDTEGAVDFKEKLCTLIEDAKLRKEIAANAKDWVRENRDPRKHVPNLIAAYQTLRDARRAVTAPPPSYIKSPEPADAPVSEIDGNVRDSEDASSPASV